MTPRTEQEICHLRIVKGTEHKSPKSNNQPLPCASNLGLVEKPQNERRLVFLQHHRVKLISQEIAKLLNQTPVLNENQKIIFSKIHIILNRINQIIDHENKTQRSSARNLFEQIQRINFLITTFISTLNPTTEENNLTKEVIALSSSQNLSPDEVIQLIETKVVLDDGHRHPQSFKRILIIVLFTLLLSACNQRPVTSLAETFTPTTTETAQNPSPTVERELVASNITLALNHDTNIIINETTAILRFSNDQGPLLIEISDGQGWNIVSSFLDIKDIKVGAIYTILVGKKYKMEIMKINELMTTFGHLELPKS